MSAPALRFAVPLPTAPGETALYRFFDADDRLLYVGISDQPIRRWAGHTERRWWREARTCTVQWYGSRHEAAAAEKHAITHEDPVHNVWGTARQGEVIRKGVQRSFANERARIAARDKQ